MSLTSENDQTLTFPTLVYQMGKTQKVILMNVSETVGLKVVDKTKMDPKMTKMLLREILVMDACHHCNLVRLYEVLETRSKEKIEKINKF